MAEKTLIITVTPNPSLDLLFRAGRLSWDDANRIPQPRRRPGGQGINVVRAARALDAGSEAVAVALLGGVVGRELEAALGAEGTPLRVVRIPGETRIFVGVREAETGRSLLLNPRGPDGGEAEAAALRDGVEAELAAAEARGRVVWVACCGSLPPGLPADLFARIGAIARGRGHQFVPDTDGEALRLAAREADLLVPNVHEAERLLGREIGSADAAAEAAAALVASGPAVAVVTMGADGAVAASKDGVWRAVPSLPASLSAEAAEGSAVGAGDAFLASLLSSLPAGAVPAGLAGAVASAVAAGTATLLSRGADLLTAADLARVAPHVRVGPAG